MNNFWIRSGAFHCALIILVGVVVYSGVLYGPFLYDDIDYLLNNPAIRNFKFIRDLSVLWDLPLIEDLHKNIVLRPVAYLTFAINYHFTGYNPAGYRIFNISVHLLNALQVYWLVRLTLAGSENSHIEQSTISRLIPLATALIFVSHPLQIQSVTYIIQRMTSLAACFYLMTLLLYIKFLQADAPLRRGACYVAALVSACLAMKTKEIAFTLPLILVSYDWLFLNSSLKKRALRLLPFLLTLLIIPLTVIRLNQNFSDSSTPDIEESMDIVNYDGVSRWHYLFTQVRVIANYMRLLLVPVNQNFDYDIPLCTSFFQAPVILSFLLIVSTIGCGLYLLLRAHGSADKAVSIKLRLAGFGILWFFIVLSVESSIFPLDDLMVEQRVYLPSVGFILAFVSSLSLLVDKVERHRFAWFATTIGVIVIILAGAALARNYIWQDPIRFWQDAIRKSPNKGRPYLNLGIHNFQKLYFNEALQALKTSKQLDPDSIATRMALAKTYLATRRPDLAEAEYQDAIRSHPGITQPYLELGRLYLLQKRREMANTRFQQLLQLHQYSLDAYEKIADVYNATGHTDMAVTTYGIMLKIDPANTVVHERLKALTGR